MAFNSIAAKFYPDHESVRKNSNNVNINQAHMCSKAVKSVKSDSGANARIKKLEADVKAQTTIIKKMMATLQSFTSAKQEPPAPTPTVKADTATKVEAGIPASKPPTPVQNQNRIEFLRDQIKSTTAKIQSSNNFRELEILRASLNGLCAELDGLEAQEFRNNLKKQEQSLDEKFLIGWATGSGKAARCQFGKPW